jgi:hypothetical protein
LALVEGGSGQLEGVLGCRVAEWPASRPCVYVSTRRTSTSVSENVGPRPRSAYRDALTTFADRPNKHSTSSLGTIRPIQGSALVRRTNSPDFEACIGPGRGGVGATRGFRSPSNSRSGSAPTRSPQRDQLAHTVVEPLGATTSSLLALSAPHRGRCATERCGASILASAPSRAEGRTRSSRAPSPPSFPLNNRQSSSWSLTSRPPRPSG